MKNRKLIFVVLILVVFFITLLKQNTKQYGYVKDSKTNLPIEGVFVIDLEEKAKYTLTNNAGLFSFTNCNDLIISKEGYKSDTLKKYGCRPAGKCFNGHVFYMISINKKN